MKLCRFFFAAALLILAVASQAGAQEFFIKDGDAVVIMGDSITEQRLYSNYVELWTVTRFPTWKLTFRNVGIGGDRSPGGNSRFKRDVLAHKPTVLTVDFGMNDGGYGGFNEGAFATYMKGLQGIADQAKAAGIRVAWITPQPTERRQPGPQLVEYNQTLEKFSEGVAEIAKKNGGIFVDQFHPYLAVMEKARATDPKIIITGGDAVHPGPAGQALMAASILKGMNFPRFASSASIDLTDKGKATTSNCKVTEVSSTKNSVRFLRLDNALPFFPEEAKPILKWTPILDDMNDYRLQVKGLEAGQYEVRVGGEKVAELSAKELADGTNLAEEVLTDGAIADQVNSVVKAVKNKTNYFHDEIFRGLLLANLKSPAFKDVPPGEFESRRTSLYEERMKRMSEFDQAIDKARAPQAYLVDILPVRAK